MASTSLTIQDLLSFVSNKSKSKLEMDAVLPFIILPILLLVCTISGLVTIIVMVFIGMGALYVISRPRQKNRSPFFYSWTLSSGVTLYLVFELYITRLLRITHLENFVLLLLLVCTCYFFYKMKSIADFELCTASSKDKEYSPVLTADSHYCQICQLEISEGYFHSIWWDCCVLKPNYMYFLAGHVFAFLTLLVGTNLGLTSLCNPYILFDPILMPMNCDNVYFDIPTALAFAACIYGVGYLFVILLVLLHQLLTYIPRYSKSQWKKVQDGLNV